MKELARITAIDILTFPITGVNCLMALLINKNVINNPKAYREDDVRTGDIVFKEFE
jgi:hypothetical protein